MIISIERNPPVVREPRGAKLRAVAALAGWAAWPSVDDHGRPGWVLTREHRTVECPSTEAAEAFLESLAAG